MRTVQLFALLPLFKLFPLFALFSLLGLQLFPLFPLFPSYRSFRSLRSFPLFYRSFALSSTALSALCALLPLFPLFSAHSYVPLPPPSPPSPPPSPSPPTLHKICDLRGLSIIAVRAYLTHLFPKRTAGSSPQTGFGTQAVNTHTPPVTSPSLRGDYPGKVCLVCKRRAPCTLRERPSMTAKLDSVLNKKCQRASADNQRFKSVARARSAKAPSFLKARSALPVTVAPQAK